MGDLLSHILGIPGRYQLQVRPILRFVSLIDPLSGQQGAVVALGEGVVVAVTDRHTELASQGRRVESP